MSRQQRTYSSVTREKARALRYEGYTYSEIIETLGENIPQSTIQGWVRDIPLTSEQNARIKQKELEARRRGQLAGAEWNHQQKQQRLQNARDWAEPIAERLVQNPEALMLMASALYLGEGAKTEGQFSISNSDPRVIRLWMALMRQNFDIDESKFACQLAISEGMDEEGLRQYWSEVTGIPLRQFIKGSIRKQVPPKTREGYKGVCVVLYYSLTIRRFMDALAQSIIDKIT